MLCEFLMLSLPPGATIPGRGNGGGGTTEGGEMCCEWKEVGEEGAEWGAEPVAPPPPPAVAAAVVKLFHMT